MNEAPTIWYPSPTSRRRGRTWLRLLVVAMLLTFLGVTLLVAGLLFWYQSDLILPGVQVMDITIGGRSTAEAAATIQQSWQRYSINLEAGDQGWTVAPGEVGIILDVQATLDQAYQMGRSWSSLELLLRNGKLPAVQAVWAFDPKLAETSLQALTPQVDVAAVDAGVRITNGRAEATPAVIGRRLDLAATLAVLNQDPGSVLQQGRLPLVMAPVAPALMNADPAAAAANQLLSRTINLHAFDPISGLTSDSLITPQVWGSWLSLYIDNTDPAGYQWLIDRQGLETFLTQEVTALGPGRTIDVNEAADALGRVIQGQGVDVTWRVYYQDRQHTVQAGETLSSIGYQYGIPYPWISQANPGVADGLFAGQTIIIPSPDVMLPLPVVPGKRVVVSIAQQRVWVYEQGSLLWDWPASTGIETSPTAPGVFQIQSHESNAYASNWDLWMPNFMGVYRPVPASDFMNGFHGFPTRSGANLLWTGDLGRKVTYGCILLSSENAAWLYDWAEDGVVVEIQP